MPTTGAEIPDEEAGHQLGWPESLALTGAILLATAVAAGWFNVMLPWVH